MIKTIPWSSIDLKSKTSGQVKLTCPSCTPNRTNKKDRSLSVNISKGLAKCHHCDVVSIRDDSPIQEKVTYNLPDQTWKNYTKLSDKIVKYCEARGLRQSTLKDMDITEEVYFQPQLGKQVNNIVFNYFEGDTLVNKKYRSGSKNFTQTSATKPIFYNINAAVGQKEVYIVEGEFDVLAMHQCGYKNTISIPNGANDNDDFWINSERYLQDVQKFFICTDNDDKGEVVSEKIAQRLGRYRCERILFKNKDANGDLQDGEGVLKESIRDSKKYPASGTFTIEDLIDDIDSLYDNGLPDKIYPKHNCFGKLKDVFSVMRGHLCVTTGIPSHGKSNFVEWYVMNLIRDHDMKASFFSPEHHPMALHQTTFIEKFFGRSFFYDNAGCPRIKKSELKRYYDWSKERIYLTAPEDNKFPTWSWLLEKFKEQMFIYGVDIFVIDAFNKLEFDSSNDKELSRIKRVLTQLTLFAQMNNVIIFLIAHPTKMQKNEDGTYTKPTLYDVSGSADFRNQTHDGFTIYRHFKQVQDEDFFFEENDVEFITQKVKMKFQGELMGREVFKYHLPSGRYYTGNNPPVFEFDREEVVEPAKSISPKEAFDLDDLPF